MGKIAIRVGVAIVLLVAAGGGYLAYRAHRGLVTLNVRNAELRTVVPAIEWQTWEPIIVHREVSGRVTLNVHNMPLERVLGIIGEQTAARWLAVYPLYSSRQSLAALRRVAAGALVGDQHGWSMFSTRPLRWGGGMFGAGPAPSEGRVSLTITNQDLAVATLALARLTRAQVVPEDGTSGTVHLELAAATLPEAVGQLAGQVGRRWTRLYTLQPGFRAAGARRESAAADEDAGPSPGEGGRDRPPPPPEQVQQFEQQMAAQLASMTPAEQQRFREQQARWQEMRSLSPEERRERFAALAASPEFQERMRQRMLQRLKDSTPEQRTARDARIVARRAARKAS